MTQVDRQTNVRIMLQVGITMGAELTLQETSGPVPGPAKTVELKLVNYQMM